MTRTDRLEQIKRELRLFVAERDWEKFHDPKNLAMAIASEAGELLAELRWVRGQDSDEVLRDQQKRTAVESEAADIAISLLLFCDRLEIDLLTAVEKKIAINRNNYPIEKTKGRSERPAS